MNSPSLSIIIPVYNVEPYIRLCMESVFRQGLDESDFEVIIVNDGTKDRSIEVIADIITNHPNITVINQENRGEYVARNVGLEKAQGTYIYMLDPDDMLIDNALSYLLEKAKATGVDLVFADYLEFDHKLYENIQQVSIVQKDGKAVEKTGEELLLQDQNPYHCYLWRSLFRRQFLLDNHQTFFPTNMCMDFLFLHECYLKAKRCLRVSWLVYVYRKSRPLAVTAFYNAKKGEGMGIVIGKTWELTQMNYSPQVILKLKDDIFTLFRSNVRSLSQLSDSSERRHVMDFMKEKAPGLSFSHGNLQRMYTFLYRYMPNVLMRFSRYF